MAIEKFNFDKPVDRKNRNSLKWDRYGDRDILPMWVADSDFEVAPAITNRLQSCIEHGVFGYSNIPNELVELVVSRLKRLYDWRIQPEWIVWFPGIVSAMHSVSRAVTESTSQVFYPSVIYPPFVHAANYSNARPVPIPMQTVDQRLLLDFEQLEAFQSQKNDLLMLCNPANPGGTMSTLEELGELADLVIEKDWLVCSDEIHCDLILDSTRKHYPIASLNEVIEARSITFMAPSKTFNTAGLGCSFAIIPNLQIRRKVKQTAAGVTPHMNMMGLQAAWAAYEDGDEWNRQQCEYLAKNRNYLIEQINAIDGLHLNPVEATYLAWIDVSGLHLDNPMGFFEAAGVGLAAGVEYGDSDFMRLNFACTLDNLKLAVERIRTAVENR